MWGRSVKGTFGIEISTKGLGLGTKETLNDSVDDSKSIS